MIQPFHLSTSNAEMVEGTGAPYDAQVRAAAALTRKAIARAAEMGVPCQTDAATDDHPWEAIIHVAEQLDCDLVVMAWHGRRGLQSLLIGSQTHQVLTHCKVPALVLR